MSEDIKDQEGNTKSFEEFISEVKNVRGPRKHKVRCSLGVYDSYKWIRKNNWTNIGRKLSEHEFYSIVRQINNCLANNLLLGETISLPCGMGEIELRKVPTRITTVNNKVINTMPIDWDSTLKLWYTDKEAYNNKTLVKLREKEVFRVIYNKIKANYRNKSFYGFSLNRKLKDSIKKRIKLGLLDAFKLYRDPDILK